MSFWIEWVENVLEQLDDLRLKLGRGATEPGSNSDLGKRQCVFEVEAVELVKNLLPQGSGLLAEGYTPFNIEGSMSIVSFDPVDGTAGFVRSKYGSAFSLVFENRTNLPIASVIAVRIAEPHTMPNQTFRSVTSAGILNLVSGEMYIAEDGNIRPQYVIQNKGGKNRTYLHSGPQYNNHNPNVACEVARRANGFHRFLIPYGLYPEMVADSHSSAMVMLWCLSGYLDVWFNFNLPGIEGAGQRGHELSAIAVFARAMEACAFWTKVVGDQVEIVGPLDEAPYTFDGQTSVILGVDEKIVRHYLGLINESLRKEIFCNGSFVKVSEVLSDLYNGVPDTRWSLPLIP